MKIKILKEDAKFSKWIRKRDKRCVRCQSIVEFNDKDEAVSHQASHYWGRGKWATRFDPDNVDTLCFACHRLWGGDLREDYKEFKVNQLGIDKYRQLEIKSNSYANRKKMLKEVNDFLACKNQENML